MRKTLLAEMLAFPVAALAADLQTIVLDVQKMTCALCSVTVKKALEQVPGVVQAKIDYDHKTAAVKFDPAKVRSGLLIKAATEAGFPREPRLFKPGPPPRGSFNWYGRGHFVGVFGGK